MGFGNKKPAMAVNSNRLASVAGAPTAATFSSEQSSERYACPEPDLSRIRPRQIEETAAVRKRRLAAKTVNFTTTIIARLVILAGAGVFLWSEYQYGGQVHRGVVVGVFAMFGDLGRVILKAMTPGTK